MPKMKAYASFAAWKKDQTDKNKRLISALARVIEQIAPDLEKTVKWGQGCWAQAGAPKVYLHAEPDHVQLGFYAGSTLKDPLGLLSGSGKHVRHVKVRSLSDVDAKAFAALILQVTRKKAVRAPSKSEAR